MNTIDSVATRPLNMHDTYMNRHVEHFRKEFFPLASPVLTKKFSQPSHVYKHVFVTTPHKLIGKKKRNKYKEESWFDEMNPFSEFSSGSESEAFVDD